MFIVRKFISDGETKFTQHKLKKMSAKNKSYIIAKAQMWDHLQFNYMV